MAGEPMKPATKRLRGRVVEVAWRPDLLKQAAVQNGDPRPHRHGLDLVVGDVDRGDAGSALKRRNLLAHLTAQTRVEVGERFVHEKSIGRTHQRPCHGDPLPLTAGQLRRLAVEVIGQFQRRRDLADFPLDVGGVGRLAP